MNLLNLNSNQERLNVKNKIQSYGYQNTLFWTSGTDLGSKNSFYWMTTGENFANVNWIDSRDHLMEETCLVIGNENMYFERKNCNDSYHFICVEEIENEVDVDDTDVLIVFED